MGVMADKDYGEMIRELLPLALDFKTVTVESERALQGEALADCIREKESRRRRIRTLRMCCRISQNHPQKRQWHSAHCILSGRSKHFCRENSNMVSEKSEKSSVRA